ncbi:4-diphosphocytidyl-2-C-methyl-D-erythritol kinase [Clostridia bacterium]|nr:4-diphosphocytidyl-2-C-methyl-D-erythritol kinase [Clostridia bacterium]
MTLKTNAYAKVNLTLDVLGKRPDGYHELKMAAQSVSLCDELTIELTKSPAFTGLSNKAYIPGDERNHAVKAARLFRDKTRAWDGGAAITINKRIPACAGLGGGSSDAAAVLNALNAAFDEPLTYGELVELALQIGSDVPFCLRGGTQLMEGRGELLTPLSPLPLCSLLLVKPETQLPTPRVFGWLKPGDLRCHPDLDGFLSALENGDLPGIARRLYNVLETVAARHERGITEAHNDLIAAGALGASMTGTGSVVFGLFADEADAKRAASEVGRKSYLCRGV